MQSSEKSTQNSTPLLRIEIRCEKCDEIIALSHKPVLSSTIPCPFDVKGKCTFQKKERCCGQRT